MLLVLGNWVTPVQANNAGIGTPIPTGTPVTVTEIPGEAASAEQQKELKSVIQSYVEIRYRALTVSDSGDFKQNGFGDLISDMHKAKVFLREEMGKLSVEIKRADLNRLRYVDYKYFLNFRSITVDPATQTATISVSEGNEVIYEISAELNPEKPIVSHTAGIEHTIVLRKLQGKWKIISDTYDDDLWRMLRHAGKSTDEILRTTDEMIRILEASPRSSAIRTSTTEALSAYAIPDDPSSHPYDRAGAVEYALQHWNDSAGLYNPNYYKFPLTDCQNFVSQALYEGGNITMFISPWSTNLGVGDAGWFYLNNKQYASGWTEVGSFFQRTTQFGPNGELPETWRDDYNQGPVGRLLATRRWDEPDEVPNELKPGDVIQYEWLDDGDHYYDHTAIVVAIEGGVPYVAAHTNDHDRVPYTTLTPIEEVRFIHIERSNGYPPVKAEIAAAEDDASGDPGYPGLRTCNPFTTSDPGNIYFGSCIDSNTDILTGFRFANVPIPRGATLKYAYVTFTVDNYSTQYPISLNIYGDASQSNFAEYPLASRIISGPSVEWIIDGTVNGSETDTWNWTGKRTTPNLKDIINPIISGSWIYGNAFSILFKNNPIPGYTGTFYNHRRVVAFEGMAADPWFWRNYWTTRLIAAYDLSGPIQLEPVVSSVTRKTPSLSPTNVSTVTFQVKFSEPVLNVNVGSFTQASPPSDFTLTTTGNIAGAYITDVAVVGSGDTYSVTVNTGSGDGTIRLDVRDNMWNDPDIVSAANPQYGLNGGFTTGESYTIDKTAPFAIFIGILPPSTNPTNAASVDFWVYFNEPVVGVDTVGPAFDDFSLQTDGIAGASITSVTRVRGDQYLVTVNTGSGNGTISLKLENSGIIRDYATNPLHVFGSSTSDLITINKDAPTANSILPEITSPTDATSVNFTDAVSAITIDLDLQNVDQAVDVNNNTVQLQGQIEHFTGSAFDDTVLIAPLTVPRNMDGGTGNDTLNFDAQGLPATDDGTTITVPGYGTVTYTGFGTVNITNSGGYRLYLPLVLR